jgi:hypothetical protein
MCETLESGDGARQLRKEKAPHQTSGSSVVLQTRTTTPPSSLSSTTVDTIRRRNKPRASEANVDIIDLAICRHATTRGDRALSELLRSGWVGDGPVPGGQASKGIRWMPRHQEAMKDVAKLR